MNWEEVEGTSGVQKTLCLDLGGGYMERDRQTDRHASLSVHLRLVYFLHFTGEAGMNAREAEMDGQEKKGGSQQKAAENKTETEVGEQHEVKNTLSQYGSEAERDGDLGRDHLGLPKCPVPAPGQPG